MMYVLREEPLHGWRKAVAAVGTVFATTGVVCLGLAVAIVVIAALVLAVVG